VIVVVSFSAKGVTHLSPAPIAQTATGKS